MPADLGTLHHGKTYQHTALTSTLHFTYFTYVWLFPFHLVTNPIWVHMNLLLDFFNPQHNYGFSLGFINLLQPTLWWGWHASCGFFTSPLYSCSCTQTELIIYFPHQGNHIKNLLQQDHWMTFNKVTIILSCWNCFSLLLLCFFLFFFENLEPDWISQDWTIYNGCSLKWTISWHLAELSFIILYWFCPTLVQPELKILD